MDRRRFVQSAAASLVTGALAAPAFGQSAKSRTLTFTPLNDLLILDPIWTTAAPSVNHGYCIFDTLYGVDDKFVPKPQMAEGHTISDDKKVWDIRLRPGLKFHDGEPVLSRDCVASIIRWAKRDTYGQILSTYVDAYETPDDRTIRIKLKKPFLLVADALAHPLGSPAFMMPERMAKTDASTRLTDTVGSGPFRFVKDEYQVGSRVVYVRNDAYVPREEQPEGTTGGKRAFVDRVEWRIIPDPATAAVALQSGETDWLEIVNQDLVPALLKDGQINVQPADPLGFGAFMRFNALTPPFNNPKLRKLMFSAIDQADCMRLLMGDVPSSWRTCFSAFPCGLPGITDVPGAAQRLTKDYEKLKREVVEAGYKGERVVFLSATDYVLRPLGPYIADVFKKIGINVDLQEMDFSTLQTRRASKEPVEKGGWSVFTVRSFSAAVVNPGLNLFLSDSYPGWYTSPDLKRLITAWLEGLTDADRANAISEVDRIVYEEAPVIPLGQYYPSTAFRRNVTGVLSGSAVLMWNVRKT